MSEDLKGLVNAEDVAAAVKSLHGPQAALLHYKADRATTAVQGFTSLTLRVTATVRISPEETKTTSLFVKLPPVMESQKDLMSESAVFEREVKYFNTVVPILEKKDANLPLVKCVVAHDDIVILEDLCILGFRGLGKSIKDVSKNILKISHARISIRKLAQLHASTLDVDWINILPEYLTLDSMLENPCGMFKTIIGNGCKSVVIIMKELYPNNYEKYTKWLLDPICYETMIKYSKANPKTLNVLCHGDFWVNNVMYKINPETNEPLDAKLIDLQEYRFAPPSRDILFFLYTSANRSFRNKYEREILRTYVEAFNTIVCETPDRLTFEEFYEDYDQSRMFGLAISIFLRPLMFMRGVFPADDDEEFSQERFDSITLGDQSVHALQEFRDNTEFRDTMTEIVEEVREVLDKLQLV